MNANIIIVTLALVASGAACSPNPATTASSSAASCADRSTKLALTGLCQADAKALLADARGAREPALPQGCTWTINETQFATDALLYRAATCKGVTTKLAYAGGAHSAKLSYETTALFSEEDKKNTLVEVFGAEPDPQGALKAAIAALPKAERAKCEIQPAGVEQWPSDALVIGPIKAARAKMPKDDGPISACGTYGLDEDSTTYWRVKQGFAWFFTLGQEELDFDPNTMSVVAKKADGTWAAKP